MVVASSTASGAIGPATRTVIEGLRTGRFGRNMLINWLGDWGDVVVEEIVRFACLSKLVDDRVRGRGFLVSNKQG